MDPVPRWTGPAWSPFLGSQAEAILACDFFTAELLEGTQACVLAVIEYATRPVRILGITLHPTGEWTARRARNLIMDLGEQAHRVKAHLRRILCQYETRHNQHRPHRSVDAAAPLKPLPQPVDRERYHVRRHARISGMINEYGLVA